MRIQHNIMAMNAYRNYTNNVSAMKRNLEKLSSGYKINRAGDDAAGLAISEKMRAQITGLQTAQKNAKDGISLVQTAEGALTEVHDMLNRMVELATQSANGTYDNNTDRLQLQKEVEQLKSEINRIADSANFNGIKLLDGSMDGSPASVTTADAVYKDKGSAMIQSLLLKLPQAGAAPTLGQNTILETEADGGTRPNFSVDLDGLTYTVSADAGDTVTLSIGGSNVTATVGGTAQGFKAGTTLTGEQLAQQLLGGVSNGQVSITVSAGVNGTGSEAVTFNVSIQGSKLVFEAANAATQTLNGHLDVKIMGAGNTSAYLGTNNNTAVAATKGKYTSGAYTQSGNTAAGQSVKASVTLELDGKELTFTATVDESEAKATTTTIVNALKGAKATDAEGNEYVLGNIANVAATGSTFTIESRVGGKYDSENAPEGLVKVMTMQISGGDSTTKLADAASNAWVDGANGYTAGLSGSHNVAAVDILATGGQTPNRLANTILDLSKLDITDGMKIRLGDETYTFAVGADSKFKDAENVVDMTDYEEVGLKAGGGAGQIMAASRLTDAAAGNKTFNVGQGITNGTTISAKISLQQLTTAKDSTDMTTLEKLAGYIGISTVDKVATAEAQKKADAANEAAAAKVGRALTLQIGDTAEDFNQLKVNIKDMHVASLGLDGIDIGNQEGAAAAVDIIKAAINQVSDVRGTLGATQNRLDHTINNLSVMTENIQDAESTIRDTDVADEMMAYTKNNILIQSAQAMLAQANQVPQGVLQLLQ